MKIEPLNLQCKLRQHFKQIGIKPERRRATQAISSRRQPAERVPFPSPGHPDEFLSERFEWNADDYGLD
ncbi:MAG: hypothetical protein DWQ34_06675 [Planctomycetota bacterium]|nr:MAG: hypothetical protein DWQ29_18780 [Planctomycetota bacterium]REJ95206.1 MAG: hypothetical protein DWQ34_06675 [Planctomycetota bacterium]REK25051.1 MAG: hypothetical protein DWQ41_12825 [Planctomycetota bacterium]REK28116.1 MAG: hypothetical protein DWQ45_25150 [Planctomycetota bacterium]